tara:strand:+ start:502 stop:879 length:378 start_codon:yes stop_codon:yes gene_type:complete
MGRYYNGDIEGKFYFGVQSSNAADQFGVTGYQPEHLEYSFEEVDIKAIEEGLNKIEEELGLDNSELEIFFNKRFAYNTQDIKQETSLKTSEVISNNLQLYADWELGKQILDCVKKTGCCSFTAEL